MRSKLHKPYGGRTEACNQTTRESGNWCTSKYLWLTASYIPGPQNVEADIQSRIYHDNSEWSLNTEVFKYISGKWGMPEVDLFASRNNFKVKKYFAWKPDPSAHVIDAFTIPWSQQFVYCFPPFCMISKALKKTSEEQVGALIVFPYWPSQPWFSRLARMLIDHPLLLRCRSPTELLITHPYRDSNSLPRTTLLAALISGSKPTSQAFCKQQKTLYCRHGGLHHELNTPPTSLDGFDFVVKGTRIPTLRI